MLYIAKCFSSAQVTRWPHLNFIWSHAMFKGKKLRLLSLCLCEEHYIVACISLLFKISVTWPIIKVPKRQLGEHSVKHPASSMVMKIAEQGSWREPSRIWSSLSLARMPQLCLLVKISSSSQDARSQAELARRGGGLSSIRWKCLASASVI